MSEYQYYEFVAVDRALDAREQAEVRSLSTRATITSTSFVNEYHWGDFRGDPKRLMEHYYDAHVYLANWGSRRVMLRLPSGLLDIDVVGDFCIEYAVTAWIADEHLLLDFSSEDEYGEFEYDTSPPSSAVVGVRSELASGDLRPLYLAWLAAHSTGVGDDGADDDLEPPVPPGLATLTAPQSALVEFLRVDHDLLAVAARASSPIGRNSDVSERFATWVKKLPVAEKNRLLLQFASDEGATARMEMLSRFHRENPASASGAPRRAVGTLRADAARRRADRESRAAAKRAAEQARRQADRERARTKRLDELASNREGAWSRVDAVIDMRKPGEYDAAVELLTDLRALAVRDGHLDAFLRRSVELRRAHARKSSLLDRIDRAGICD